MINIKIIKFNTITHNNGADPKIMMNELYKIRKNYGIYKGKEMER